MPSFIQLGDIEVPVNGTEVPLARSGVRYHRGSVTTFTNGSKGFDGLIPTNREFLECKRDTWGMGGQTFAVDVVEDGVHRQDRTLLDLGLRAIDWGVAVPINAKGIHELHRRCDGKTVADFGYTHHTTQWLESLSRTTYLLASSPWAGEYRAKIDAYRRRIATIANLLMKPDVKSFWVAHVRDGFGNDFTHRTFMRAAAMGMASTLATRPSDAKRWAADAKAIARRGIHNQLPSGRESGTGRLRRPLPDVRHLAGRAVRGHAGRVGPDEAAHGPHDRQGDPLDADADRSRDGAVQDPRHDAASASRTSGPGTGRRRSSTRRRRSVASCCGATCTTSRR